MMKKLYSYMSIQPAATYMTIKELISMSYEMFGFISQKNIDKMRDAAKLEVSQVCMYVHQTIHLVILEKYLF